MTPAACLAAITAVLDERFRAVEGLPCERCQTGDLYEVVKVTGSRLNREGVFRLIDEWNFAITRVCLQWKGGKARLYWRQRPQIERGGKRVQVYSRFVITDRPARFRTVLAVRKAHADFPKFSPEFIHMSDLLEADRLEDEAAKARDDKV